MLRLLVSLLVLVSIAAKGQIDTVTFTVRGSHEYTFFYSSYTSLFDRLDRPYIYSAAMELGIICFDVSDIDQPVPVDTLTTDDLGGLNCTNLFAEGERLYASLGGFQGVSQAPGLAIINIDSPENMSVVGSWISDELDQGAAIAIANEGTAFLGCMEDGIVTLDVSDESTPSFISQFVPFVDFPSPPGLFSHPNARGMDLLNDILYVCNDAGGLRTIDVSDPANLVEIDMYVNLDLDANAQPAYNNCKVYNGNCYIPVDYCGLDVADVNDVSNVVNQAWYNPWNCSPTNWDGRDGHTNQLVIIEELELLFLSGADSELLVYNISNPENASLVGEYVNLGDNIVSWGVDVLDNRVVLSYVNNPLGIPYDSNVGGIQILEWSYEGQSVSEEDHYNHLSIFPVPASHQIQVKVHERLIGETLTIVDMTGQILKSTLVRNDQVRIDVSMLPRGIYQLRSTRGQSRRFIVN